MDAITYTMQVPTTKVRAVPSRKGAASTVKTFTPGVYTQGTVVAGPNQTYYIVTADGTYETAPVHRTGLVGGLLATVHRPRKTLLIQNQGGAAMEIFFGNADGATSGVTLSAGATLSVAWTQCPVDARSTAGAQNLLVSEMFV